MDIKELRQKYPEYNDMSDEQLAQGFHKKYYSDMSFGDFSKKIGFSTEKKVEKSVIDTVLDGLKKASGYVEKPKEVQTNSPLVDMIPGGEPIKQPPPESSLLDKIYGAGETALAQGSALGGSMLAWPAALGQAGINNLTGSGPTSPPEVFEQMMQGMYQPKTDSGKRQNAAVNENVTRHLMGAFPAMHDVTVVGNTKAMRRANEATMQEVRIAAGIEAAKKSALAAKEQEMAILDMQEKRSQGGEIPYEQPELIRGPGNSATMPELQLMNNAAKEEGLPFKQDMGADAVGRALETQKQAEIEQAYRQKAFDEGDVQPSSETLFKQREQELAAQQADDFIRQSLVEESVKEPAQRSTLLEPFKKDISSRGVRNRQRGALDLTQIYEEGAEKFNLALSALTDKVAPLVNRVYPNAYKNADGTPHVLLHATRDDTYGISKKPWDARDISRRRDLGIHLGTTATSPHIRNQAKLHLEPPNTMQDYYARAGEKMAKNKELVSATDDKAAANERILPYILDADRVPYVDLDAGAWTRPRSVIPILQDHGLLTEGQVRVLEQLTREVEKSAPDSTGMTNFSSVTNTIRDMLKGNGIKAIEYKNTHENVKGARAIPTSVVVIDEQALVPLSDAVAKSKGITPMSVEQQNIQATKTLSEVRAARTGSMGQLKIQQIGEGPTATTYMWDTQRGAIDPVVFAEGLKKLSKFVTDDVIEALKLQPMHKSRERIVLMPAVDFLKFAEEGTADWKTQGVLDKFNKGSKLDYNHIPQLLTRTERRNRTTVMWGHEGRHRTRYMLANGADLIPVRIKDSNIRWSEQGKGGFDDYGKDYPTKLQTERGDLVDFPIPLDEANLPNAGKFRHTAGTGPVGQRQIANAERGSINLFGSSNKAYEEYARRLTESVPGITKETIDKLWGESVSTYGAKEQLAKLSRGVVPVEKGKISFEKITQEEVIEALKASEDSKTASGWYRDTLMPGGYMPSEFTSNPGLKAGYRYLKSLIDRNARKAEDALFKSGEGLINLMNKEESVFGPGQLVELTKEWWRSKDNPEYVPNIMDRHKSIDAAKTKLFDTMLEEVNSKLPEKKQIEALPFYIPSIHDGKWYVEVVPKGSVDGRPVLYGSHNKYGLQAKAKMLEMQGHTVSRVKERGALKRPKWAGANYGDVNEMKSANYQYMLDLMKDDDPAVVALAKEITQDTERSAMNTAGANQRLKEYHGFEGNLGNNPFKTDKQNYYDTKKALINTIESHYSWLAAQDAAALNKAMLEQKVPEINRQILEKYIYNNVIGRNPTIITDTIINGVAEAVTGMSPHTVGKVAGTAGNITTAMLTAFGSPIHALQNVVQPLTVVLPFLFKEGGSYMDLASMVTKIPAEYMYVFAGKQLGEIGKALGADNIRGLGLGSEAFKAKMQYAEEAGIINPTIVDSAPMFRNKIFNRVADLSMQGVLSRPTEQAARWSVFSAMYDLGIRKGKTPEAAATRAREITETYMVDYGPDAKAQVFQQLGHLGSAAGRLQSFATNQIATALKHIKDAPKSVGDAAGALTYFGVLAALGGVTGMVGFDVIEKLVNYYKSGQGKTFSLRNEIRTSLGDAAISGIWGPTFGLGAAPSFSSRLVQDNNTPSFVSLPVAGRMGQVAETVGRRLNPNSPSWSDETEMEKGKEILSVTPVTARSFVEDTYLRPTITNPDGTKKQVKVSPTTGAVTHEYKDGNTGVLNIRSAAEAKNTDVSGEKFKEREQEKEQNKKIEKEISRYVLDTSLYGNKTPGKEKVLEELLVKYMVDYGHDRADVEKLIKNSLTDAAISDPELAALRKLVGKVASLKTKRRVEEEIKYQDLRKPQKGLFNFGAK